MCETKGDLEQGEMLFLVKYITFITMNTPILLKGNYTNDVERYDDMKDYY